MDNNKFVGLCKDMIVDYLQSSEMYSDSEILSMSKHNGIYVVWLCKALQNNKALLSTTMQDTRYYEITYNGDKGEVYFDSYIKEKNICKFLDN
jgi:hypothetical protein